MNWRCWAEDRDAAAEAAAEAVRGPGQLCKEYAQQKGLVRALLSGGLSLVWVAQCAESPAAAAVPEAFPQVCSEF